MRPMPLVLVCVLSAAITLAASAPASAAEPESGARLSWTAASGVTLSTQSPAATLLLDGDQAAGGPVLLFPKEGLRQRLSSPTIQQHSDRQIVLRCRVADPAGKPIEVIRRITLSGGGRETELVEEFTLIPSATVTSDLEIQRPFAFAGAGGRKEAVLPLYNGWARTLPLAAAPVRGEYRLGNLMRDVPSQQLALPVVRFSAGGSWQAAISADPFFGSLFELSARAEEMGGAVRYRYAASRVPLAAGRKEVRHFGVWLSSLAEERPQGAWLDAFFRLMLPDVPPAANWAHEIAMVDYDYLSDNGQGWQRDVKELARLLTPAERRRVALCYHGWYETIGGYSYDDAKKEMKDHWLGMGRTRKAPLSPGELRRQFKLARDLGFRVLLYFADGLLQDSAAPTGYRPAWDFVGEHGEKVGGWQGPDTWGNTYARNPANPQVFQWHQDYMAALLKAFGADLDGFVWDETMHMRQGMVAPQAGAGLLRPGDDATGEGHDRPGARRRSAEDLSHRGVQRGAVDAKGRSRVCDGRQRHLPGHRLLAGRLVLQFLSELAECVLGLQLEFGLGLWQHALGRRALPCAGGHFQRLGRLLRPVEMVARGSREDHRPVPPPAHPWQASDLSHRGADHRGLDRQRSDSRARGRRGQLALAARGAKATASSVYDSGGSWGPAGVIDGRRDKENWGHGHGWASRRGQAMPQWVEIQFPAAHEIARLVVITYHGDAPNDTAAVWGVTDYQIQVWDEAAGGWKTVVDEERAGR